MDEFLKSSTLRKCAFGLVDPAMTELLSDALTSQILVPKRLTSSSHLMPVLLNLRQETDDEWNALLALIRDECEQSQHPPVALFVTTNVSIEEFSRHWNSIQLAQTLPPGKLWLRVHDPRVLHQLLRILNSAQRRRLFGRSQAFHYWIGGEWITAQRDGGDEAGSNASSGGVVGWDWHRVQLIGLVNRALLGARIKDARELTSQATLAEQLIDRAIARYGLADHADLVEFAIRGLQSIPLFDEHPVVARAIRTTAAAAEDARLSDRFALIEEHVWAALSYSIEPTSGQTI